MSSSTTQAAPASYAALREAAVLVDRNDRLRMVFSGEKAKESLGGLVTNDVALLAPGVAHRSLALTPKGRVIAMVRVIDRGADLLVDAEPSASEGFATMIRKFVNPRLAKFETVSSRTGTVGVYGPQAATHVAAVTGADAAALTALKPLGWISAGSLIVIASDDFGGPGFDLIGERDAVANARAKLEARGLPLADAEALDIAAVESGLPRFGIEMDAETIPQEANLDALGAMSFNKGCFTGQEVVARIHFRGHVNRHLRRLRADAPLARGDLVLDETGKEVGDVRSATVSPAQGPIAIAMVRREVELGTQVSVQHDGKGVTARVESLT